MTTTDDTAIQELVRDEIEYRVRTSAAYGYGKGKRGTDIKESIDYQITMGTQALMTIIRAEVAKALRDAAPLMHDYHDEAWLISEANQIEKEI